MSKQEKLKELQKSKREYQKELAKTYEIKFELESIISAIDKKMLDIEYGYIGSENDYEEKTRKKI